MSRQGDKHSQPNSAHKEKSMGENSSLVRQLWGGEERTFKTIWFNGNGSLCNCSTVPEFVSEKYFLRLSAQGFMTAKSTLHIPQAFLLSGLELAFQDLGLEQKAEYSKSSFWQKSPQKTRMIPH